MLRRLFFLILLLTLGTLTHAQNPFPTPERFVNAIFHTVVDSTLPAYYLIKGTDTCRFVHYDYDEWEKYHLKEPVPISILNELAEKVYLSKFPYFWKADSLTNAVCITRHTADSLLSLPNPYPIFSFSLPQFTDDGQYAVIDLNMVCGPRCGLGTTYIFRRLGNTWTIVGIYRNWSA